MSIRTAAVHLAWAPLGVASLQRFRDSYMRHDAGVDHELVVIYNGFSAETDVQRWDAELADVPHSVLRTPAAMQDLAAYRHAAGRLGHEKLCFLNSHSIVLADGWLGWLSEALDRPQIGLAGTTGSWASIRSLARFDLGFRGPYHDVFSDRAFVRAQLGALTVRRTGTASGIGPGTPSATGSGTGDAAFVTRKARVAARVVEQTIGFAGFPAPHIRTNGFAIRRSAMLALRWPATRRKAQSHRFESGPAGLTAQIRADGLQAVVVDRHGTLFDLEQWPASGTFWQGRQDGLLVADNQTSDYEHGDEPMRRFLSQYAWGAEARPS